MHRGLLDVAAVDLGVGALLLDDEDVDAQPEQVVQDPVVEVGEAGGADRGHARSVGRRSVVESPP
ncbi:hypothetical protein BJF82_15110 [Kytococcus sp. CUA-901]|nr:hypothetical protein BJF82_15110 [Kytococcus sp. CUA-901]